MGQMNHAIVREEEERRKRERFASTLVIAASIIAAVRLAREPDTGKAVPACSLGRRRQHYPRTYHPRPLHPSWLKRGLRMRCRRWKQPEPASHLSFGIRVMQPPTRCTHLPIHRSFKMGLCSHLEARPLPMIFVSPSKLSRSLRIWGSTPNML